MRQVFYASIANLLAINDDLGARRAIALYYGHDLDWLDWAVLSNSENSEYRLALSLAEQFVLVIFRHNSDRDL